MSGTCLIKTLSGAVQDNDNGGERKNADPQQGFVQHAKTGNIDPEQAQCDRSESRNHG